MTCVTNVSIAVDDKDDVTGNRNVRRDSSERLIAIKLVSLAVGACVLNIGTSKSRPKVALSMSDKVRLLELDTCVRSQLLRRHDDDE